MDRPDQVVNVNAEKTMDEVEKREEKRRTTGWMHQICIVTMTRGEADLCSPFRCRRRFRRRRCLCRCLRLRLRLCRVYYVPRYARHVWSRD